MNQMNTFKTDQLSVAEIRLFNEERKSSTIPEKKSYTILLNQDGKYLNILNPILDYPVYERVPYANILPNGEGYGTMISHVSGEIKDGPCYIIDVNMKRILSKDMISYEEILSYVLQSGKFFPDRISIIENMDIISRMKYRKKYLSDKNNLEKYKEYMNSDSKHIR